MRRFLILNAGSSSLKYAVYRDDGDVVRERRATVSGLSPDGMTVSAALDKVLNELEAGQALEGLAAIGHRIVHGGQLYTKSVVLTDDAIGALDDLIPLAPLHQPYGLHGVAAAQARFPMLPQVGAFDTAFHASIPELTRIYALPKALRDDGVLAYGFHGLSYAFIAGELRRRFGAEAGGRVIVAHLGNGSSLCALKNGVSIATSMGFSALDGLVMGTRCGSIDPGVVLYLMQVRGLDAKAISDLLYKRSGLLGLSGLSNDMRTLLASGATDAKMAVDKFVLEAVRHVGSLAAVLGGVDKLVFTAGIGENAPIIRERIITGCQWLAATAATPFEVLVIPTDEEAMIAADVAALV
jgi:acetate kinase